jgi:hypothetical protein
MKEKKEEIRKASIVMSNGNNSSVKASMAASTNYT